jgi:REP element-mobilizing transposase RayT
MTYDERQHHRRSIRLKGYDYSQAGAYFVTVCTRDRVCLFGDVRDGIMRLNKFGHIVWEEWFRSAEIRREIELSTDEFVVMPNHIHGIVWIAEQQNVGAHGRAPLHRTPRSLSTFIAGFKSVTTKRINILRNMPGLPVWQRNYYEHIVRDERTLDGIREYILANPLRWHLDRENPNQTGEDDAWVLLFGP